MNPRLPPVLSLLLLLAPPVGARPRFPCLPPGVRAGDVVSAERTRGARLVTVTVEQTLRRLRARCAGGRLVDGAGREVRFHRRHCFGAPTGDAMETLRRERAELDSLRSRFTVIEMTCSPTGEPTP